MAARWDDTDARPAVVDGVHWWLLLAFLVLFLAPLALGLGA